MANWKAVLTAVALVSATSAAAQVQINRTIVSQPTVTSQIADLDRTQILKIEEIRNRYDSRILAALNKQPALKAEMEASLKAIGLEKDPARRKAMIAAYNTRFGAKYEGALKAAGLSFDVIAREMGSAAPQFSFARSSPFSITGAPRTATTMAATSSLAPAGSTSGSTIRTVRLTDRDFETGVTKDCSFAGGVLGTATGLSTRSLADSVTTAKCSVETTATYRMTLQAGEVADLTVNYDLSADSDGFAVTGGVFTNAASQMLITSRNPTLSRHEFANITSVVNIFALGASNDSNAVRNRTHQSTITGPTTIEIKHNTDAYVGSIGIATGSKSEARSKINSATIVVRRAN
jgi:hypothetical protein